MTLPKVPNSLVTGYVHSNIVKENSGGFAVSNRERLGPSTLVAWHACVSAPRTPGKVAAKGGSVGCQYGGGCGGGGGMRWFGLIDLVTLWISFLVQSSVSRLSCE